MTRALPASLFLFLTAGCLVGELGSGDAATEVRDAPGAIGFENALFMRAEVTLGDEPEVAVTCDDNLLDDIVTEVEDGVLVLRARPNARMVPRTDCVAHVRLPEIRSLAGSGSGTTTLVDAADGVVEIVASGSGAVIVVETVGGVEHIGSHGSGAIELAAVRGCSTDIVHTGSGRVVIDDVRVCDLTVANSGSGRTLLGGAAAAADVTVMGSGGFGDDTFVVQVATLRGSGSGGIELTVTDAVEIDLSGSGGATVHGEPAQRDVTETGSGRARFPGG